MVSCYTGRTPVLTQPFYTFVLCILEQYAYCFSKLPCDLTSWVCKLYPARLGDGFHLNWGVLRAVHLRTLDNSSILVHVTNKFHETIHYHLLAVERKKNRLHKISFQNGKKAGTVLAWMYTFLLAMWSNQEANQGKLFTLKKINGLWL